MIISIRLLALAALVAALPATSESQIVGSRGSATSTFAGPPICQTPRGVGRDKQPLPECLVPTPAEIRTTQRIAALQAVERFVAEGGETAAQAFDRVRDSMQTRFDDIVLSVVELTRSVDAAARQVTVMVRVDINEARLRTLLGATSAVGRAAGAEKSLIGMFMLARTQSTVERFDGERSQSVRENVVVTTSSSGDSARSVRESEALRKGTVVLQDSVRSSQSSRASAEVQANRLESGSTTLRADRISYAVAPAQDLESTLGGRLSAAGYETVEAAFLEDGTSPGLLESVRSDFGGGDDLKATTLRMMASAAQRNDVRFALVGTVDVGLATVDEVTGNQRVVAKVSAKVYDMSGRLPRTVVNVGPVQFAGLGPDAGVARTNALKEAATQTAKIVLDQLGNREVK